MSAAQQKKTPHKKTRQTTDKNTGIPYERLTQQIFQEILDQNSVRTIEVQHDVTFQGKTVPHQVDVYWDFERGGIKYATVVQARDWATRVKKGNLLEFKGVLDDLPGQPRGVFVTRTGYQSGAATFARANGIMLYELTEEPAPANPIRITAHVGSWAKLTLIGIVERRMLFEVETFDPHFLPPQLSYDASWASTVAPDVLKRAVAGICSLKRVACDVRFYDDQGRQTGSLQDIHAALLKEIRSTGLSKYEGKKVFDQPTFLRSTVPELEFVKIVSITTPVEIRRTVTRKGGLPPFVEFVLKNLDKGTVERRVRRDRVSKP